MEIGYLPWNLAGDFGSAPALRDDHDALDHRGLDARTEAFADQLRDRGIGAGDVIAVMLPNRIELLIAIFGAWRLGAVVTVVNPAFTASEAAYQLEDSGARLAIAENRDDLPIPTLDVSEMRTEATSPVEPHPLQLHDLAFLIYTSGSTGRPKGVMLDHANVEAMTSQIVDHAELTAADHCLLFLPLFHANALMVSAIPPLRVGGQVSILRSFSPTTFFDEVERLRPTYFSGVPAVFAMLTALPAEVQPDTSSLRFVVCGAAPVSAELLEACQRRYGFELIEGYGLTEATCGSAINPLHGVRKLGTVGPAVDGQQIRIVDEDGDDQPPGEPGEILIAGPTVMRGYLGRPEETAETVVDGWLHTGDVGTLDGDGYLSIVDRIKDMIIRGGENLYPKEIEAVIGGVDGVLESAVVGRPDGVMGEVPVAHVVTHPDATVTEEQILDHCRQHLMRVKVPVEVHLVAELPRNPVGKIDKPALREQETAR